MGKVWTALAVIVGLMVTNVIPFEGAWKWSVFTLILILPFGSVMRRRNKTWVFWEND